MGIEELEARLRGLPRVPLAHLPTPLEEARRLSDLLGGPRIWIKRDDLTGLALGGNNPRKLEFLFLSTGSGTTQAGLILGAAVLGHGYEVVGISVQQPTDKMVPRIVRVQPPVCTNGGEVIARRVGSNRFAGLILRGAAGRSARTTNRSAQRLRVFA